MRPPTRCPCGSGEVYPECCGRFHGGAPAPTARDLMAARFCAFAVGDVEYLRATWHPRSRPARLQLDPEQQWTRLEIVDTVAGGPFDASGVVEFRASFRRAGERGVQHERSRFVREAGRWLYVDGEPGRS